MVLVKVVAAAIQMNYHLKICHEKHQSNTYISDGNICNLRNEIIKEISY